MFIDKTIAKAKVRAHNKTPKQIQEIQQQSIDHIRSISEDLLSLMDELSDFEPSMTTPNASPINIRHKRQPSSKNSSQNEQFLAHSFFKSGNTKQLHQSSKRVNKKTSVPAIHYATYMKPTHHVKEKIREILIEERQLQLEAEEKERRKVEELKKKANKNYSLVQSRYQKYHDKKAQKTEAIANRQIEKEFEEMSGVTFKPKINKNVAINQSFDERLENNKHKKSVKEVQIIKDMIKGHTYKPKINDHIISESKVKKLWSPSSSDVKSNLSKTQPLRVLTDSLKSSPGRESRGSYLRADASDLQFMISQSLFEN